MGTLPTAWTALVAVSGLAVADTDQSFTARVLSVSAGHILRIDVDGTPQTVLLFGAAADATTSPWGQESKEVVQALVEDRRFTFNVIEERGGLRYVRLVLPTGERLAQFLVREGLARWDRWLAPDDTVLKELEARAKSEKRGRWSGRSPVALKGYEYDLSHDGMTASVEIEATGEKTLQLRGDGAQKKIVGFEAAAANRIRAQRAAERAAYEQMVRQVAAQRAAEARTRAESMAGTRSPRYDSPRTYSPIRYDVWQSGNVLFTRIRTNFPFFW